MICTWEGPSEPHLWGRGSMSSGPTTTPGTPAHSPWKVLIVVAIAGVASPRLAVTVVKTTAAASRKVSFAAGTSSIAILLRFPLAGARDVPGIDEGECVPEEMVWDGVGF